MAILLDARLLSIPADGFGVRGIGRPFAQIAVSYTRKERHVRDNVVALCRSYDRSGCRSILWTFSISLLCDQVVTNLFEVLFLELFYDRLPMFGALGVLLSSVCRKLLESLLIQSSSDKIFVGTTISRGTRCRR